VEQSPVRAELLALFEKSELTKYFTGAELSGPDVAPPPMSWQGS
jgi:hypothetical protein